MIWVDTSYLLKATTRLHELNEAQGDVIIKRSNDSITRLCTICDATDANINYDWHCSRCWEHLFPETIQLSNYHTKEKSYMYLLRQDYPVMVLDKTISGGCSRKRPDGFIGAFSHVIIIEIDEINIVHMMSNVRTVE